MALVTPAEGIYWWLFALLILWIIRYFLTMKLWVIKHGRWPGFFSFSDTMSVVFSLWWKFDGQNTAAKIAVNSINVIFGILFALIIVLVIFTTYHLLT